MRYIAGVAALALYDLGQRLAGPLAGVLAAGFFLASPEFALWNTYILTDSLYISAVILTTWLIHKAGVKKGVLFGIAALAVLATATIRPSGWLFIPIAGLYWMTTADSVKHRLFVALLLIVVASITIFFGVPGYKSSVQADPPYQLLCQGEIVLGYEEWRLVMPEGEEASGSDIMAVLRYSLVHPLASLRA